jgi:hypothetical protein
MRIRLNKARWTAVVMGTLAALALSVSAQQSSSLAIAGQSGSAAVRQIDGHNYVEVEGLARLTNAALSFNGSQIVLNLSGSASGAGVTPALVAGFSKAFVTAGIEAMSQVREWHAALRNAIESGYPLRGDWLGTFQMRAQQSLRLAALAVSTDSDKSVMPFLTNEFNNMSKLSDKFVQKTKSMSYFGPDALKNDALDQKIVTCAHSLATMATTNQFVDDGSCQ